MQVFLREAVRESELALVWLRVGRQSSEATYDLCRYKFQYSNWSLIDLQTFGSFRWSDACATRSLSFSRYCIRRKSSLCVPCGAALCLTISSPSLQSLRIHSAYDMLLTKPSKLD